MNMNMKFILDIAVSSNKQTLPLRTMLKISTNVTVVFLGKLSLGPINMIIDNQCFFFSFKVLVYVTGVFAFAFPVPSLPSVTQKVRIIITA